MNDLMTGAVAMGFACAALFFFRFWRDTHDRLFGLFALSFLVLAVNRAALVLVQTPAVNRDYFFWVRFAAFAIILLAILDKNRSRPTEGR